MKELNMKPEEIANLVVLSREKGYAIVIPQDSLYLVSKAFQKQLAQRDAQITAIESEISSLAGAMLNRILDSGSKQAVAYADCADMVAKFAKKLREGK
mgnify:CR=1 FL=1